MTPNNQDSFKNIFSEEYMDYNPTQKEISSVWDELILNKEKVIKIHLDTSDIYNISIEDEKRIMWGLKELYWVEKLTEWVKLFKKEWYTEVWIDIDKDISEKWIMEIRNGYEIIKYLSPKVIKEVSNIIRDEKLETHWYVMFKEFWNWNIWAWFTVWEWDDSDYSPTYYFDTWISKTTFWNLDFSKCEPEFLEKNKEFFEKIENISNMRLVKDNNWYINHFSLLSYIDKDWKEQVIPTPVFFEIIWDDSIYSTEYYSHESFFEQDEENEWVYREYFMEKFNIILDDSTERGDIRENSINYYTEIRSLLKNNTEEFFKLDDEELNKYLDIHHRYIDYVNIFDTGLSEDFIVEYSFKNNILEYFNYDKSEEKLSNSVEEFLSNMLLDDVFEIEKNTFFPEWVKKLINKELEKRKISTKIDLSNSI